MLDSFAECIMLSDQEKWYILLVLEGLGHFVCWEAILSAWSTAFQKRIKCFANDMSRYLNFNCIILGIVKEERTSPCASAQIATPFPSRLGTAGKFLGDLSVCLTQRNEQGW
jgi:hypothetical protein